MKSDASHAVTSQFDLQVHIPVFQWIQFERNWIHLLQILKAILQNAIPT